MVTISPATEFASVTRVQSGHSATFSRTVTASPGPQETIVSTTLTLQRGGMTIPIPYYGDLKLNNNVSFTLNFDMNDSKEFKSGDKIDLEEGAFSSNWKAGLRVSYQFSNKISGGLRYEYRESDSRTMGKKLDRDFGFDINIAITG